MFPTESSVRVIRMKVALLQLFERCYNFTSKRLATRSSAYWKVRLGVDDCRLLKAYLASVVSVLLNSKRSFILAVSLDMLVCF